MKVVMLNGAVFESHVAPVDLWLVYRLVRDGHLEAVLIAGSPIGSIRKIDADATFSPIVKQLDP